MTFSVRWFCLRFYKPNNDASREARGVSAFDGKALNFPCFVLCFPDHGNKPLRISDRVDVHHHDHDVHGYHVDYDHNHNDHHHDAAQHGHKIDVDDEG